ncbi:MAG TPA: insulinase family protein, partial [Kofleriaceae bacterium]|nr:insulinase family protein [Kofleriaceae bacterium]
MRAVIVGACVAAAGCHVAHPPPAPVRQSSLSLSISGLSLPNGLRVVVVRDPAASEIGVTMRYRVGSIDDGTHPGMAHLVEHLMFQQMLGAQSLFAHLEDDATEFNGLTSFDTTTYIARAPKAKLDELLSIEAVRVGFRCTTISDAAFEREREVVVNELRQRDAASELSAALHDAVYPPGHPYHQPTGGSVDSVRAITRDQACAFADAHYAPSNGVLVVSGNLTPDEVIASLKKFLARVAKRDVVAPASVAPVPAGGAHGSAPAPIDDAALVIAWPLPADPHARVEVDAIAAIAVLAIDAEIAGRVHEVALGDVSAPMLGFVIEPGVNETLDDVRTKVTRALDALPSELGHVHSQVLGDVAFDMLQQSAIYREYAKLESPAERDAELAQAVLDGHDPNELLAATFTGLRDLTPDSAAQIARTQLAFDQATVVELQPAGKKTGHEMTLAAAVHDVGQRRDAPDPADAHKPLEPVASPLAAARTRTLPNGLKVVLLPLTSVPAVDIRLVFAAGTADEDAAHRGVAIAASRGLQFDPRYLNDLLLFAGAGGSQLVQLEPDTTTFEARGVDMHIDLLLAGLRRWVREGTYVDDELADALRAQAKLGDDGGAVTDAWRTALYGKDHPYVAAGLVRHISHEVSIDDVRAFRAAHYTPDNATLVIAGRFDAALADQWIDFLFGDWQGHAAKRTSEHAQPAVASLARFRDTAQVHLAIALPATTGTRAARLVAGEMLQEIADDVRHRLGASYGLQAAYTEQRLAGTYAIAGSVDAARTSAAMQLVRDRLAELRASPEAAFVTARRRVVAHLDSLSTSATGLAARVEHAVATDQPPLGDVETTAAVRAM